MAFWEYQYKVNYLLNANETQQNTEGSSTTAIIDSQKSMMRNMQSSMTMPKFDMPKL